MTEINCTTFTIKGDDSIIGKDSLFKVYVKLTKNLINNLIKDGVLTKSKCDFILYKNEEIKVGEYGFRYKDIGKTNRYDVHPFYMYKSIIETLNIRSERNLNEDLKIIINDYYNLINVKDLYGWCGNGCELVLDKTIKNNILIFTLGYIEKGVDTSLDKLHYNEHNEKTIGRTPRNVSFNFEDIKDYKKFTLRFEHKNFNNFKLTIDAIKRGIKESQELLDMLNSLN